MAKERGKPMQRFFLSKVVTKIIDDNPETGPAIDFLRDPKDATKPFWPDGTRKTHLDYTGQGWALTLVTHLGDDPKNPNGNVPIPEDPDVIDVPEFALDAKLSGMDQTAYQKFNAFISSASVGVSIDRNNDSLREVLTKIGKKRKADFNLSYFGLPS